MIGALAARNNLRVKNARQPVNIHLDIKSALSRTDRPYSIGITTILFAIDVCGTFKSHDKGSRDWANSLTSFFEKMQRSNNLQIC